MKTKSILSLALSLIIGAGAALQAATTAPTIKKGEMPEYPVYARSHNIQGVVIIEALIDEQGRIFAAEVVQSVHKSVDQAALAAVQDWSFQPATENGQAVMKVVHIPIRFSLVTPDGQPAVTPITKEESTT